MTLPRHIFPATPRAAAEYAVNFGWETASVHGESSRLLNVNGHPTLGNPIQVGYPSLWQPFPTTAADLIAALGATGVILPANVLGIYLCNTASPLVCSLGLGPNLVAAGGPLTGRECVGLPDTSFTSKVGVELVDNTASLFADAGVNFMTVADGTVRSFLMVLRFNPNCSGAVHRILSKEAAAPWTLAFSTGASVGLYGSAAYVPATVVWPAADGAWDCVAGVLDALVAGSHQTRLYTTRGDAVSALFVGSMNNAVAFTIGNSIAAAAGMQIAYVACFDVALTSAMRAAFWRHAQAQGLSSTPKTYARANPLVVPISASRVACYGAGQVGVGYDASLVSAALGNALGTGTAHEDGITWLGLGTTNQPAWVGTNATNTATDGPSGMRDSARVADADVANAGYVTSGSANLAGATAVPFEFAAWRQAVGGGGTNAVYRAYYTGDGGGPEELTWATDAGTVPAAWGRVSGNCTPVGNAHTAVVVRLYPTDAVAGSVGTVDFYVEGGVQNRNIPWLAHRRCAAGATSATSTPGLTIVNANQYYNPLRGRAKITIGGFQGTSGAIFLDCGVAGTAGSMQLNYNAGQLILRCWDATPALVAAVNCGAVNTARHTFIVMWDSLVPIRGAAAGGHMIVAENGVILGEGGAAWVSPTAAVTPVAIGSTTVATGAARCFIELEQLISDPGAVSVY